MINLEREMSTWSAGDIVTFQKPHWTGLSGTPKHREITGQSFVVKETIDVPEDEIAYNPDTHEGGVGHHQWLVIEIDGEDRQFSGSWFEK